ncbi:hypothetical protein [Flammeovirga aprica]|uniref:Outer membrane protein beta-barrel domain-containing protein n=1 Tax=Flammeovirga aprica JL-4 TaxID=694437 RepID=A0A7X9S1B6_9BACT|nr:hypothetical protein [Flammeovirga aprica]NME72352.1 hypothetical protein [Flammeovirga aprica JL-4]
MRNKLLFIITFLFVSHFSSAQIHFGIGGGGSSGVGDLSPFSSAGFSAYIEFSYNASEKFDAVLVGHVNGLAAIPIDASLSQAWYQIPILLEGRYFFISKDAETTFHPYVQGGIGAVRSYYLKSKGANQDPEVLDKFWKFGARVGVGTLISIFNVQLNYNYGGSYEGNTLSVMDLSLGLRF